VEPAEDAGRSRWRGEGQFLSRELCGAIRRCLAGDEVSPRWSRRAVSQIEAVRSEFPWLRQDDASVLVASDRSSIWWTFSGGRANLALAHELVQRTGARVTSDNFGIRFPARFDPGIVEHQIQGLREAHPGGLEPPVDEQAVDGLKFSECLPLMLATRVVQSRLSDSRSVGEVLLQPVRVVHET
jgi:ATP-dependent Lhr-like helicase